MDISLGGCSIVSNSKYEAFFERGQKVLVHCNNPLALRSGTYNNKDEEPFHQMVGHITRITSFIDQTHEGLCHIHVKFDKLQRRTKIAWDYSFMDWKMYDLRIVSYLVIKAGNPAKIFEKPFVQQINP